MLAQHLSLYDKKTKHFQNTVTYDSEKEVIIKDRPEVDIGGCILPYDKENTQEILLMLNDLGSKHHRIVRYFRYWRSLSIVKIENRVTDSEIKEISDTIMVAKNSDEPIKNRITGMLNGILHMLHLFVTKEFSDSESSTINKFTSYVKQMEKGINKFSYDDYVNVRQLDYRYRWLTDKQNENVLRMMRMAPDQMRSALKNTDVGNFEGFFKE